MFAAFICMSCCAQWFPSIDRKGNAFAGWGWNRAAFSNSDIHFRGANYNFTLSDVHAKDRQTAFNGKTYFGPKTMTIPQTNIRGGFFFGKNWSLTVGVDHMKYVMVQDQTVSLTGQIGDPQYAEMVHNGQIELTDNFLTFEHTDGLNYLNAELECYQGIYHSRNFQFNAFAGFGAGALMPKSNVKLMGYPRNDQFHLAGYGGDLKAGIELLFCKIFFLKYEVKGGYINMPNIVTRAASEQDRASQHFMFAATDGMFGVNVTLVKNKAPKIEAK